MMVDRIEVIAAACHVAWYAYTVIGLGESGEPWATAPEWQKESLRNAIAFWDKKTGWGTDQDFFDLINLPEASHNNWLKHKCDTGWTYGVVKDPATKTHPCMVPYNELSEEQQKKDLVVVEAYLALRDLL